MTSGYYSSRPALVSVLAASGNASWYTFVTYGELTEWTLVQHWGPRSLETMRTFLGELVVLPQDQRVAVRWGEIQAYQR